MITKLFKSILILAIATSLLSIILNPVQAYSVAQTSPSGDLSKLPITFPTQTTEVINYFNDIARPDDLASLPNAYVQVLSEIKAGQAMVGFSAWEDAESTVSTLTTPLKLVIYNPEHWENTPATEQQNLAATVQKAADYLHARDIRLFLAPDRRYVDEALEDIALYADALMLQGQRIQDNPELFGSWMKEKIATARKINPDILIYVQVGANQGTPDEMLRAVQTVADQIDGIAIWSTPRYLDSLKAFINLLRPPDQDSTPSKSPKVTPAQFTLTPEPSKTEFRITETDTYTPIPSIEATETPSHTLTLAPTSSEESMPIDQIPLICLIAMIVFLVSVVAVVLIRNLGNKRAKPG